MKDKNLLSIGEASKITGMHVKSLRYYDRLGVFSPEYIDPKSGYRYYRFEQLQNIIAVRTCLETGIALNYMKNYTSDGATDYKKLITDAKNNVDEQMRLLEKKKTYLDFLEAEVRFNAEREMKGFRDECYGSLALWRMPLESTDDFSRKETFLKMADDAREKGYQLIPLYYGMLMTVKGEERKLYAVAGVEDFFHILEGNDTEELYQTPAVTYRRAFCENLEVTCADEVFPDLFALDYDKVVLTTISLTGESDGPRYSMFINLP